jgi:transposase
LVEQAIPEHARGKPVELWWQDEAWIGQHGTLTYVWGEQGTRPPAPRDCRYDWAYIFGVVCPARGTGAALVMPHADKPAMTLHLAEISQAVAPGAHAVVLMDGAGWHKPGGRLVLPSNVSTLTLPAYAPELNPQENVWQFLRQNHLANRVFDTYDTIVDACCQAWTALMQQPERITAIASREWAKQVTV